MPKRSNPVDWLLLSSRIQYAVVRLFILERETDDGETWRMCNNENLSEHYTLAAMHAGLSETDVNVDAEVNGDHTIDLSRSRYFDITIHRHRTDEIKPRGRL